MTEHTADLLVRVAEFLRKVTPEQMSALAAGEARLDVVPKGARITGIAPKAKAPVSLSVAPEQVEVDLKAIQDRDMAIRYVKDLGLNRDSLIELARALNVKVTTRLAMDKIIEKVVEQKVGTRLDMAAIMRG